jgi:hypothetical protein
MLEALERFGVADEEVAAGLGGGSQLGLHEVDIFVAEIDQHVSAEH